MPFWFYGIKLVNDYAGTIYKCQPAIYILKFLKNVTIIWQIVTPEMRDFQPEFISGFILLDSEINSG